MQQTFVYLELLVELQLVLIPFFNMSLGTIFVKGALNSGVLCKISEDHGLCYKCSVCMSKFTGHGPAYEHLLSKKHANAVKSKSLPRLEITCTLSSRSSSHQSLTDTNKSTTSSQSQAEIKAANSPKKQTKPASKKDKAEESNLDMYPRPNAPSAKSQGTNRRGAQSLNDLSGHNTNQKRSGKSGRCGPPPRPLMRPPHPPQDPFHPQRPPHPQGPPYPQHPPHPSYLPHPRHAGLYNDQERGGMMDPPQPFNPHASHYGQPNHGPSPLLGDPRWQNNNYPPYLHAGPYPGQGPQPLLGHNNPPADPHWSSDVRGSNTTSNYSGTCNTGAGGATQDVRNSDQSTGARNRFLDLNALLIILLKAPNQKLSIDQICRQLSCSMNALKTVCFQNSTLFKDPLQGDESIVELYPNLGICDDYLEDSGCRSEGHCGKLHICLSFIKNVCSSGRDCDLGHNWKSSHNSHLWSKLKMESLVSYTNLLRSLVKKVIVGMESISVCSSYNKGSCTNGSCLSLHICLSTVSGGAKCDSDKCSLNHDIFHLQCKKILLYFGINTDDSKRDVITKVRMELDKLSQKKQSKKEQSQRKTSTGKMSTTEKSGKASDSTKLGFFSTLADQKEAVKSIVRSLLVTTDFWNSTEQMYKLLNLKSSELRSLLEHYSHVFRVHVSGLKVLFKLRPRLQMCQHYNQETGCDARDSCFAMHLCKKFVNGNCNNNSCELNHSLLAHQNRDIIKRCFLDGVPQKLVLNYFKRRFSIADVPNICLPYNEERCNAIECDDLHICYDQLFTVSSCFRNDCVLNHDLFDEENARVFQKYNFKKLSQREILSVMSLRINPVFGNRAPTKSVAVKTNSSTAKPSPLKPKTKTSTEQTTTAKPVRASAPKVSNPGITSSYALEGNVACPAICLDALASSCQPDSKGCPKLHSRVSYHWQFTLDNLWYNFSVNHSNSLETAFRDVSADSVILMPTSYGRTPAEKQKFVFMEEDALVVDFDLMGLKTRRPLKVRRLSTPSSVISNSPFSMVYGWYFKDKNDKWIEYGNSDSSVHETHSSKETSTDIETVYQSDMNGSFYITSERFKYTLNFAQMQQTNEETKMARCIRRRPKYANIEKLQPNDPYGLKSAKIDQSLSPKNGTDRKQSSNFSQSTRSRPERKASSNVSQSRRNSPERKASSNSPLDANVRNSGGEKNTPSQAVGMGPNFPSFWKNMTQDGVECFTVDLTSQEAFDIISSVLFTMPNADVTRIRRLQNTFHWEGFSNQMDYFKIATKKPLNIQRLFHGTREKYVDSISTHNFEWRQSFADTGNMYGRGAYFFNNAAVAHAFASARQAEAGNDAVVLAIADVFVGSIAVGTSEMTRPPPKQTGSTDLSHTTVNDLSLPTIFVKYDKSHYCPHYFVDLKL